MSGRDASPTEGPSERIDQRSAFPDTYPSGPAQIELDESIGLKSSVEIGKMAGWPQGNLLFQNPVRSNPKAEINPRRSRPYQAVGHKRRIDTRRGRAANLLIFHNAEAMIKILNGSLQKDIR